MCRIRNLLKSARSFFFWGWKMRHWRWWDWGHLLYGMELMLEQMEKGQRTKSHHVHADRDAKQLMVCKNLCRRLRINDYESPWEVECSKALSNRKFVDVDWPGLSDCKVMVPLSVEDQGLVVRVMEYEENLRRSDLELLTKLMRKHLRSWWD